MDPVHRFFHDQSAKIIDIDIPHGPAETAKGGSDGTHTHDIFIALSNFILFHLLRNLMKFKRQPILHRHSSMTPVQ